MSEPVAIPGAVLAAYGEAFGNLTWRPVGEGLSDARVFAGSTADFYQPSFALKRWPPRTELVQVAFVHQACEIIQSHFTFVPKWIANRAGRTFTGIDGVYWELSEWLPGQPSDCRSMIPMDNAGVAIAELHGRWASASGATAANNALRQRIEFVNKAIASCGGLRFKAENNDLDNLSREAKSHLRFIRMPHGVAESSQIIHGDLHREHILFNGDSVSGIIDFSSIKCDHPALDLARYFGECGAIESGVAAYHRAGGSHEVTVELVRFLDRVILLGSAAHWLKRFAMNDVPDDRKIAAIARFEKIVQRLRQADANGDTASPSIP